MEEYLRVATPDIPALFPRPAWDLSCKMDANAGDMARLMDDYGAVYLKQDKAKAEYRARGEEAKVWRHKRDEDLRLVLEARALQAQTYRDDLTRRVDRMMEYEEKERVAGERRAREAERVKIEEQKRNEERRQLEEKRREAEKRKKEEKKRREEETRKQEEERQKRKKVVEEATAQAKEKQKRRDEQKELKARVDAEEYKLFLVKEAEREELLADEAREQLAKKSEEADRARMARAEKDWQKLQEKESAEGVPVGAPAFSYRSKQANLSREAFESLGNLRDRWNGAALVRLRSLHPRASEQYADGCLRTTEDDRPVVQQIQCNCPEGEEILHLGRKRHGAAQREERQEESCFQAAAGGQPSGTRPGWGEPCGGRDGRGAASRAWAFRCEYRSQWK